jgi:hypothetical protein
VWVAGPSGDANQFQKPRAKVLHLEGLSRRSRSQGRALCTTA